MQKPVEFQIDPKALATSPGVNDRYVYTPTFAPYDPFIGANEQVVIPNYQIDVMAVATVIIPLHRADPEWVKRYEGLGDRIEQVKGFLAEIDRTRGVATTVDEVTKAQRDVTRLGLALREALDSDDVTTISALGTELTEVAKRVSYALSKPALTTTGPTSGGGSGGGDSSTTGGSPGPMSGGSPEQELAALAESALGVLFLDRTRIRPLGFALGEHVHSLSLAPGEEVILEEKVYSKREESFERASEREQTFDTEMSSTLTTELNEGMGSERSRTGNDTDTMAVNVGGNIDGITFNVGPTWSSSVQEADKNTTNFSLKTSVAASTKVAARNRAQHKIVYKVSTESRFETTARRTLRNPNANTPIDLQYFKILQRLDLSQERFGVRLCWAPAVPDPGGDFLGRFDRLKKEIYDRAAAASAGPRPAPPVRAGTNVQAPRTLTESKNATGFDRVWGGQSADYDVVILAPPGLEWDRGAVTVSHQFTSSRPNAASLVQALASGTGVRAIVHVGVTDCNNPLMVFDPALRPFLGEPIGTLTFTVSAVFVPPATPSGDPIYDAALALWREQTTAWEAADQKAKADARKAADEAWATLLAQNIANTNVMHETIGAIIRAFFPSTKGMHIRQIDFWENLFDWKNAGLRLYPSWWTRRELRDAHQAPDAFVNASWARIYLPIKPGAEETALRWIYERVYTGKASPRVERLIARVLTELQTYRRSSFGTDDELQVTTTAGQDCPTATEKYLCLGHWEETLPTNGTHLEVMQATSSAADDHSRSLLDDAAALRAAQIERAKRENALRQKAEADGLGEISTTIDLNVGNEEPPAEER
jgi:hypothetical protein